MFDTLSKEIYFLKQGSGENVARFGVCLSQQAQILQSEYLGRIQQKHIEKMKQDHFYEGLNPKYQHMLAHNIDGEHPTRYSDMLLVAPEVGKMGRSQRSSTAEEHHNWRIKHNTFSDTREFFPSQKLKGSHTFTTQSNTVESNEAEEDLGVKPEEEEEAEFSAGEDAEALSGVGGADQLVGYIVCFANVVKLYQRKN